MALLLPMHEPNRPHRANVANMYMNVCFICLLVTLRLLVTLVVECGACYARECVDLYKKCLVLNNRKSAC